MVFGIRKIFKNRIIRYSVFGPYSLFGPTLLDTQPTVGQPKKSCINVNIYLHKEESINLRKFSTVSGISSVSTVSTKTLQSEMVISEEDEDRTDEL